MKRALRLVHLLIYVLCFCLQAKAQTQTVINGTAISPFTLPGSSCIYNWTVDKAIGLSAGLGLKIPSFTAINTGTTPITATISVGQPNPIYNTPVAWIVNQLSGKVWLFGVPGNQIDAAVLTGSEPYAVVANNTRTHAYVTNKTSGTVSVLSIVYYTGPPPPASLSFLLLTNIPVGKGPEGLILSPDESKLYVVNSVDETVSVISTVTNSVTGTITLTALNPSGIAISPDGSKLYVTGSGSGSVSVIDAATNKVSAIIKVGSNPQNIVISPDGSKLYVTNQGSNNVSIINTADNSVVNINAGSNPSGIALSRDGTRLYITNQSASGSVTVINLADNSIAATVSVGSTPTGLAVSPDGTLVYITNSISNSVSVIATSSNTVTATFDSDNLGGHTPFSDYISGPAGCALPFTYTITVLPTPPAITATGTLQPLNTTAGAPSATTSFTVSGISLPSGIVVTPPTGFEVSTDGINFSPTLTVGTGGNINPTKIYVRLSGSAPVGQYTGDIALSSGAATATEATATSTVTTAVPAILAGKVSGKIISCAGSPSAIPNIQQFSVTAIALNGVLSATAPTGFEVSTDPNNGYAVHVDITNLDASGKTIIYVRSSASALGSISGNVSLNSPGAATQLAAVSGIVYSTPTVDAVASQTVSSGNATKAIAFTGTNANSFNWTNDQPGIGLAASGGGNIAAFTAINAGTSPVVATITVTPISTAVAYVVNEAANSVSVINVINNAIVGIIKVGALPQYVIPNADGSRIYVANNSDYNVMVINTATNTVIATIPVGKGVNGMAFSPDGTRLDVSNSTDGTVSEISTITNTLVALVDASTYGKYAPGTKTSADGNLAYVYNGLSGIFGIYSTATNNFITSVGPSTNPQGLTLSNDGKVIYISNPAKNTLDVFDQATNTLIKTIAVGGQPQGISLSTDGTLLFVTNGADNTVSVINTATYAVISTLSTNDHFPNGVAVTGGTGCNGAPVKFTITVNPPVPTINAAGILAALTTIYSVPSVTTTFTVSGTNLTEQITITPPNGFEVSTDGINFDTSVAIGGGSDVPPTTIYIRLAATTPVGTYTGNIIMQSLGAADAELPTAPANTVTAPLQTIFMSSVTGSIAACQGSASASPFIQQFTVTGKLLTGDLTITAPANFEISLNPASGYTNSITRTPSGGSVGPLVIYVRSVAQALGSISGTISLVSPQAIPKNAAVSGYVTFTPTVKQVGNVVAANGNLTPTIAFTGTGNTYNWVNDTPGIGLAASGGGNIAPFTAVNTGGIPVTATITVTPVSASLAYIANYDSNTLSVINTQTNQQVNTIRAGSKPFATAVSPDGAFIYVADQDGSVSKVDAVSGLVRNIPVGQGTDGIAISPDGKYIFTANGSSNDVTVIDAINFRIISTIPVGIAPLGIVVSPDGTRLYVANRNTTNVYVIDLATYTVISKITTQASPEGLAISPDGSTLYVTNYNAKSVSVINTVTNTVVATITVGTNPMGISVSPDGKALYVANGGSNTLTVINTADNTITATIPVGKGPNGVSVSPDGTLVYVANSLNSSVSVISTATNKVTNTLIVGTTPVSIGNFISSGQGCTGIPTTFTITVNPFTAGSITASGTLTGLKTVYGTPSASATFNVSGAGLTAGILITPPLGFEASTDNSKFSSAVTVAGTGIIGPVPVYIRLAAATPAGGYSGSIVLSSTGATAVNEYIPNSTVATTPLTITADNKSQVVGAATPVFTATYKGFVNSETPAILTTLPTFATTAVASSKAGSYPITVSGAASPNYSFVYAPGVLIITNGETTNGQMALTIPNAFTPNGDGINDTWNIGDFITFTSFTVQVFNRLGQSVYFSNNYPKAWDGTYKGAYLPTGTYYYLISAVGSKPISGPVTIIR